MNKIPKISLLLFSILFFNNYAEEYSALKLGYELSNKEVQGIHDIPMQIIKNEYSSLKNEWNVPKNRKKKPFWNRLTYCLGYQKIDENSSPFLYKTIIELADLLKINSPKKKFGCGVYICRGNKCHDIRSFFTGKDAKLDAYSLAINQKRGVISIGEELITSLSYPELRVVLARKLAGIKKNHLVKNLILANPFMSFGMYAGDAFTTCLGFPPLLSLGWNYTTLNAFHTTFDIGINYAFDPVSNVIGTASDVFAAGVLRKNEKEADLYAYYVTQDKENLMSALEKIENLQKTKHPYWYKFNKTMEYINPISFITSHILPTSSEPSEKQRTKYLEQASKGDVSKNSFYHKVVSDMTKKPEINDPSSIVLASAKV